MKALILYYFSTLLVAIMTSTSDSFDSEHVSPWINFELFFQQHFVCLSQFQIFQLYYRKWKIVFIPKTTPFYDCLESHRMLYNCSNINSIYFRGNFENSFVQLGAYRADDRGYLYKIDRQISHPDYDKAKIKNDIALLRVCFTLFVTRMLDKCDLTIKIYDNSKGCPMNTLQACL